MVRQLLFAVAGLCSVGSLSTVEAARPNVLMIVVDDLNDWVGCLKGHPQVRTPFMDELASRGTLFANAHCQSPLCNPSRTSVLTGLRPSSTGIYGLQPGLRDIEPTRTVPTIFQQLSRAGYRTSVFGKVFHDGSIPPRQRQDEVETWGPAPPMPRSPQRLSKGDWSHPLMDWGVFPDQDEDQADWKIASAAIAHLQSLPPEDSFCMAVGFRLPHVPCFASQPWFDLYPANSLVMPPVRLDDRDDVPFFAWYLHWQLPEPRLSALQRAGEWERLVRAYLATTSFVDSQIGRVLQTVDDLPQGKNTIVVLWSDHGWHLGEKGITGKNTLWERSTRVPLIWAGPGISARAVCQEPVELLDIYPTLLALCDLPAASHVEGRSLIPQLKNAAAPRDFPAITTHNQHNHAVRDRRYRYIRYANGAEELYDLENDPHEWTNLVSRPESPLTIAQLKGFLPAVNLPPAPGSAHRILEQKDGQWFWEGSPIVDGDLER